MSKQQNELGANVHVDARVGHQGHRWRGIVREGNQGTIPDQSVWLAENVRLKRGKFVVRGGQAKVNATPLANGIEGLYDCSDTGAPTAFPLPPFYPADPALPSCPVVSGTNLYMIGHATAGPGAYKYNGTTLAEVGAGGWPNTGTPGPMVLIGNRMVCGYHGSSAGTPQPRTILVACPSGTFTNWSTVAASISLSILNVAYLPSDNGVERLLLTITDGNVSEVWSTSDGLTYTNEATQTISGGSTTSRLAITTNGAGWYHASSYYTYVTQPDDTFDASHLYQRDAGGGTYTQIPNHANLNPTSGISPGVIYVDSGGTVWVAGDVIMGGTGAGLIAKLDGASLSLVANMGIGGGITSAEEFNSIMYFGDGTRTATAYLFKVVGGVTASTEYNFTTGFPADALGSIGGIRSYNGSLYVIGIGTTSGFLYKSNGTDTTSWTKIGTIAAGFTTSYQSHGQSMVVI